MDRRVTHHRGGRGLPRRLVDADVVLVSDGLAGGVTAEAAVRTLRHPEPRRLVLAEPVCAHETVEQPAPLVDDVVCALTLDQFGAARFWYENENYRRVGHD